MATQLRSDGKPGHSILLAQTTCLFLGTGMILWALAPALVERLVTGHAPSLQTLSLNALVFMLGIAFLGMHVLVRRCVLWAVWAAFLLSAMIAGAGLALLAATGVQLTSSFLPLLSTCTCLASWLALATLSRSPAQRAAQPESPSAKPKSPLFK